MNENQYQQQDDEDESIEFINFLRAEGLRESNQPPPPSPQRKRTFNPKQPFEIATQPEDRPVRKRTSLPAEAERPEPEKPKEEQERKSSRDLSGFSRRTSW